jgi:hypothetical protein
MWQKWTKTASITRKFRNFTTAYLSSLISNTTTQMVDKLCQLWISIGNYERRYPTVTLAYNAISIGIKEYIKLLANLGVICDDSCNCCTIMRHYCLTPLVSISLHKKWLAMCWYLSDKVIIDENEIDTICNVGNSGFADGHATVEYGHLPVAKSADEFKEKLLRNIVVNMKNTVGNPFCAVSLLFRIHKYDGKLSESLVADLALDTLDVMERSLKPNDDQSHINLVKFVQTIAYKNTMRSMLEFVENCQNCPPGGKCVC